MDNYLLICIKSHENIYHIICYIISKITNHIISFYKVKLPELMDNTIIKSIELINNSTVNFNMIQIDNNTYTLFYYTSSLILLYEIKLLNSNSTGISKLVNTVKLPFNCNKITSCYNKLLNVMVILGLNFETQNFIAIMINNNCLFKIHIIKSTIELLNLIKNNITTLVNYEKYNETYNELYSESYNETYNDLYNDTRYFNIIIIPGGVYLLSYGYLKLLFMISEYSISIYGSFIDYESYNCIDMMYDHNNGTIITIEKMISGECFIQVLDIFGEKIQQIACKNINKELNICPYSIAYIKESDDYCILYSQNIKKDEFIIKNLYIHLFKFNGDQISLGMKYKNIDDIYYNFSQRIILHNIKNINKILYIYQNNVNIFETNYEACPYNYIGIISDCCEEKYLITTKGNIYYNKIELPNKWLGKKLYIQSTEESYPNNLSTIYGIFFGTCLDAHNIIISL